VARNRADREFKLTDAATNPQRSFEMWDLMLYQRSGRKNIQLLLDTAITAATTRNGRIVAVQAISPWLEERYEISAEQYIDCTGMLSLRPLPARARCAAARGAVFMARL